MRLIDVQNKAEDFKALYASIVQNTDDPPKVPTIIGTVSLQHRLQKFLAYACSFSRRGQVVAISVGTSGSTCIADGDTKLVESLVVVEYLDAKYSGDKPLLPREPVMHAKVLTAGLCRPSSAFDCSSM